MELSLQSTRVFEENYDATTRIVVNRGGTRSSKTFSLVQLAVLFLATGYISPAATVKTGVWSFVRKSLPSLKASVLRDFDEVLHQQGLYQKCRINKTELTYTYQGRMVEFFSIDDQQKVRSRKRTVLNVCEANEIEFDDYRQLVMRTEKRVYLDFNPDDDQVWINLRIEQERAKLKGDVTVIVSSYLDNSFLLDEQVEEIELLSRTDDDYWKIFGLGQYVVFTNNRFFKNFSEPVHVAPAPYDPSQGIHVALDFNITNSALIIQSSGSSVHVLKEYRAELFDLETLCALIQSDFPDTYYTINGDASGKAHSALTQGNASAYDIVKYAFGMVGWDRFSVPSANPSHLNSYLQCLMAFKKLDWKIDPSCTVLINDLRNLKIIREPGKKLSIDKSNPEVGHLADCIRYYTFAEHQDLLIKS